MIEQAPVTRATDSLTAPDAQHKLDELAAWSPEDYPAGPDAYWSEMDRLGEQILLNHASTQTQEG